LLDTTGSTVGDLIRRCARPSVQEQFMRRVGAVVVECLGQGSCTHGVGGVRAWEGGEVQQGAEGVQANTKKRKNGVFFAGLGPHATRLL